MPITGKLKLVFRHSRKQRIWRDWFNKNPDPAPLDGYIILQNKKSKTINVMASTHIVPELINANLDVIEEQVLTKLPPKIYPLAKGASDKIGETAAALYDGEEPNGPQVEKIWRDFVNTHLVDFATEEATEQAQRIKSDVLRNVITLLIAPASRSLKDLTDEITDDGAQLKAEWVGFLRTGSNLSVLLNNTLLPTLLLIPIINESTAAFLVSLAEGAIRKELEKL